MTRDRPLWPIGPIRSSPPQKRPLARGQRIFSASALADQRPDEAIRGNVHCSATGEGEANVLPRSAVALVAPK